MRSGRLWIAAWLLLGCDRPEDAELRALRVELGARTAQVEALQAELEARNAELAQAREESRRCQSAPPSPEPAAGEPPAGPSLNPSCAEGRCVVARRELEALVDDRPALFRLARVVPAMKDGAMIGLKLFALRPGSPLALLGFQDGDTVRSLAGVEINSIEALTGAYYEVVRKQDRWTIQAVRDGEPFEVTVELQ